VRPFIEQEHEMGYTLEQFTDDCRDILKGTQDRAALEQVRDRLEALLKDDAFVARYCGPDAAPGPSLLYQDPELGFHVLGYAMSDPHESQPHDHGASWAVYGQAAEYTDMTEWRRLDDGTEAGKARLEATGSYRLEPGQAGIFDDHAIHSIAYPAGGRFVRITGVDLDRIKRARFDLKAETMVVEYRNTLKDAR